MGIDAKSIPEGSEGSVFTVRLWKEGRAFNKALG